MTTDIHFSSIDTRASVGTEPRVVADRLRKIVSRDKGVWVVRAEDPLAVARDASPHELVRELAPTARIFEITSGFDREMHLRIRS